MQYQYIYKYFSKEKFVKIKDIIFFLPERLNKTLQDGINFLLFMASVEAAVCLLADTSFARELETSTCNKIDF